MYNYMTGLSFSKESVVNMVKIGDVLILELSHSEKVEKYKCRIVEKTDKEIFIDYPINMTTNRTVFLIDGTQLKGSFVSEDQSVYTFDCEILRRVKRNIPMIVLTYPGDENLLRIQRRQFVRIETAVDVAVHPLKLEFPPLITITSDISAGGAAIVNSNEIPFQPNMEIQTWFVLPMQNGETHYLKLKSRVIRVMERQDLPSVVSVQFTDVSHHDRSQLLRFCFDRQLAHKKKGLEM